MQPQRSRSIVPAALLAVLFIVVQATSLTHEMEHVAHQHDEPCGLHVVADHLAMATAAKPALGAVIAPVTVAFLPSLELLNPPPKYRSDARAPPVTA